MQKEILIITNYFPPEKGAASNRIFDMANAYKNNDYKVLVVCPLPNYPKGKIFKAYKNKYVLTENIEGLEIKRLWLFASNSKNKFLRLLSMLSFGLNLFVYLLFKKTPKKVIIQCSPLFVGFFGVVISKLKRKIIILNVSDLWPLAGLQMGILKKGFYYNILERVERFNYKSARLILGQSKEILNHIKLIFPEKSFYLYRNLPNFKAPKNIQTKNLNEIKIVYAGLLGVAQGVANICENIKLPKNVIFDIYGDGPEVERIIEQSNENSQLNYHGLVNRDKLHKVLVHYNFTLIPLTNRIYGSVPSKIFEYSRLGLPIIFLSEGEGSELVDKYRLGYTLKDNDINGLNNLISNLANQTQTPLISSVEIRKNAIEAFDFNTQFKKLLETMNSL